MSDIIISWKSKIFDLLLKKTLDIILQWKNLITNKFVIHIWYNKCYTFQSRSRYPKTLDYLTCSVKKKSISYLDTNENIIY